MPHSVTDVLHRLFSRSKRDGRGCLVYTRFRNANGYGQLSVGNVLQLAHRAMWTALRGPIPDGMCVLHRCDNPACVDVEHLWLGTQQQNQDDMDAKGRRRWGLGARHAKAKLTEEQIPVIRAMDAREAAKKFGVTLPTVYNIKARRIWRHVP